MKPLISIIVPVYKVEKYLPRCLDSILNQTYTNLEIILVDDGSPDSCGQICDEYAKKDRRIRVIHKENAGLGEARNTGLDYCNGEYIMFVDSDDYLSENAVQSLYERMEQDGSDLAQGNHTEVYEDRISAEKYCGWTANDVVTSREVFARMHAQEHIPCSAWGKLYKASVFEKLRYSRLVHAEDLWIYPDILDACRRISLVDANVYFYLQRNTSMVNQKSETAKRDELDATLRMVKILLDKGMPDGARRWFRRGVSLARDFRSREEAKALIWAYFDAVERRRLMTDQPVKIYLRWITVCNPIADSIYCRIKRLVKGK